MRKYRSFYFLSAMLFNFLSLASASERENTYVLGAGGEAVKRLDKQNDMLSQETFDHLINKVSIKEGDCVWDVGCGSGAMTIEFARMVGETGKVIAIDFKSEQLDSTRSKIEASGLNNVEYVQANILDLEQLNQALSLYRPDFIFHRLVLMHLNKPELAVQNFYECLKPGGFVLGQESLLSWIKTEPKTEAANLCADRVMKIQQAMKINLSIGEKLAGLYNENQFCVDSFSIQSFQITSQMAYEQISITAKETDPNLIKMGVISEEYSAKFKDSLEQFRDQFPDGKAFFYQGYLIAHK